MSKDAKAKAREDKLRRELKKANNIKTSKNALHNILKRTRDKDTKGGKDGGSFAERHA